MCGVILQMPKGKGLTYRKYVKRQENPYKFPISYPKRLKGL